MTAVLAFIGRRISSEQFLHLQCRRQDVYQRYPPILWTTYLVLFELIDYYYLRCDDKLFVIDCG